MTASEYVKSHGFKSLKAFAEETGISKRTILDWYSKKPRFLEMVVEGAKVVRNRPTPVVTTVEVAVPEVCEVEMKIDLELHLYIENNSSTVRGVKKAVSDIEKCVLFYHDAKKNKSGDWMISFEYTDKADLDEQVYDLLNEIESEADSRNCYSESSVSAVDENVDWQW